MTNEIGSLLKQTEYIVFLKVARVDERNEKDAHHEGLLHIGHPMD